jgi:hypothetical protein
MISDSGFPERVAKFSICAAYADGSQTVRATIRSSSGNLGRPVVSFCRFAVSQRINDGYTAWSSRSLRPQGYLTRIIRSGCTASAH